MVLLLTSRFAVLVAIAIPVFTTQLEKSRDTTSASNIRAAYAEAQASYLTEIASDNNVTVNKTGNKVTSIAVANVKFEGVQPGWSGAITDLPNNCNWTALGADANGEIGGAAGSYTLLFTYNDDGTMTLTSATKA